MDRKPNILFITSDQQRWDHTGLTGLKGIKTPALDRLGSEGAYFTRAYCPSPLCTPTRLSWLTGVYPSIHRGHTLGITIDPFFGNTIPQYLKDEGYRTALIGKSHFTERRTEESHLLEHIGNYKSNEENPFDGPYVGFDDVQLASGHNANTIPEMHYKRYLEREGVDYESWFPKLETGEYDEEYSGIWDIPEQYHNTAWVGDQAELWLQRVVDAEDGDSSRPWFCWMSFEDPHEPMYCPEPWFSRVDRSQLKTFETDRPGEFDDKPPFYKEAVEKDWSRFNDGYLTPCVFPRRRLEKDAVTAMQATVGMIGFIDHRIERILKLLEDTGQLENTIIIYTADHGEMHGHHGFWGKGLTAYEDCQRVPLFIWAPAFQKRKGRIDEIINTIDLPRFILESVGITVPQGMQGFSIIDYLKGEGEYLREGTVIESNITSKVYQMTYVNKSNKIVIYRDEDWGELYDLENDPDQYDNLWDKNKELRAKMLLEMTQQRMMDEGYAHPRKSFG